MHKPLCVLIVLTALILSSGCSTTTTGTTQSPVQPATGSLELSSTPQGAEIYLDGVYRGTTPSRIPDLPNGSYRVELRLHDHMAWDTDVLVQAGNTSYIDATLAPIVVPTTTPTPVPTTVPPEPFLGCWELNTYKGNGTGTYHLALQSGGSGRLTVGYPMIIHWSHDPTTDVIYVSCPNPNRPTEIFHMDLDYDETTDTLIWREISAPYTRVPC
ncbi:MAG: PEGA domain-containing protein [Methanomicrobiaceae archaeon]|nr:PEGA domain-containing protein [Methanomicrobiaceae archaeon]